MVEHKLFHAAACPACGKRYTGGQVTLGWRPCDCVGAGDWGGHITARCRSDGEQTGCGHVYVEGHVGEEPEPLRMPNFGQGT